jgi:hypothetical protein
VFAVEKGPHGLSRSAVLLVVDCEAMFHL